MNIQNKKVYKINKLKAKVERTKPSDIQEDLIITVTDNENSKQVCRLVVKKITSYYKVCLEEDV